MIQLAVALAACLAAWTLILRAGVHALPCHKTPLLAQALDIAPILLGLAAMLAATARPLLSGLTIIALTVGLSAADRVKRAVLFEPVVFADRAELLEVVRHPRLYLPFAAGPAVIAAILAAAAVAIGLAAWVEPPIWQRTLPTAALEATLAVAASIACFALPGAFPRLLARLAALYTARLTPSRDPARDGANLGPLACFVVHSTLAAAERPARRIAAASTPMAAFPPATAPVIVVQAESFLDPARLHPDLAGLLPAYETARGTARQSGKLTVPAWGANTVRSEFAVLTGLPEPALGLDYYNPYEKFARTSGPDLPSIARAAHQAGYHTIFLHPFDLSFYNRRHVLPSLGFDELVGPAAFTNAPRVGPYVADEAVAEIAAALVQRHGPKTFIYIATMQAHGPWDNAAPAVDLPPAARALPQAEALARWLHHLKGTDRLIATLTAALTPHSGWLAFFGDHQPTLPETFAAAGLSDRRTDYFLWHPAPGTTQITDLDAHNLASALIAAMTQPR